ncbi:MAG TPA: poly-beta-1,6-N-acetyl-D-glucosamine N-deacetylase PgaB, partial [Pasteurellaceae bacterium]|nr:poly-beta-1,6-N-acetyl-D-glucosamine N-deacetylase PgaB [Pasteurellaceae bacterium]
TDEAAHLAEQVGFDTHMSLVETKINTPEQSHVGRLLLDTETSIETIADYLAHKNTTPDVQRSIRVRLDSVYDPNPVKQKKNLDELVERIHRYGITKVYLQAFSDMNNDGVAEALYFNNKYLPIRADIFGQIAWILDTRLDVEVYAWMPIFAFDVKEGNANLRLSPNEPRSIEIIKSIYADLSFYNKFDGILFHHDAFLSQVEEKTQDLFNITDQLKEVVYPYSLKGRKKFKTARSLTIRPESEAQFVQDLEAFTKHYSTVLVQAMPYMEDKQVSVREARNWLNALVKKTLSSVPSDKVLFELQTVNWRTQKAIADDELIDWMKDLQDNKVYSFGYYPDNFLLDQPSMKKLRPYFSVNRNIGLQ